MGGAISLAFGAATAGVLALSWRLPLARRAALALLAMWLLCVATWALMPSALCSFGQALNVVAALGCVTLWRWEPRGAWWLLVLAALLAAQNYVHFAARVEMADLAGTDPTSAAWARYRVAYQEWTWLCVLNAAQLATVAAGPRAHDCARAVGRRLRHPAGRHRPRRALGSVRGAGRCRR